MNDSQVEIDAATMASLREFLKKFDRYRGQLKREDVRTLLAGIIEAIRPATKLISEVDESLVSETDCGAVWMLSDLVDALGDADAGRRNPLFEPLNFGGSNVRLNKDRQLHEALVDLLNGTQKDTERPIGRVARDLAEALNKNGSKTPSGKPWTARDLLNLRARAKGRKIKDLQS